MVYRSRALNWNLLVDPVSRGIEIESQASRGFADAMTGAGHAIGAGLTNRRQEAESRRRFDANQADEQRREAESSRRWEAGNARENEALSLRKREIDLRDTMDLRKRQDEQSAMMFKADRILGETEAFTTNPTPQGAERLKSAAEMFGSPGAAQEAINLRAGLAPTMVMTNPYEDYLKQNPGVKRTDANGHVVPEAQQMDSGVKAPGACGPSGCPKPGDAGGVNLRPESSEVNLRPPQPVGPLGVPIPRGSAEIAPIIGQMEERLKILTSSAADLANDKGSATSPRAQRALKAAETKRIALSGEIDRLKSEHGTAVKAEGDVAAKQKAVESDIAKSKDQANDLIAWGGPEARQRYMGADYTREDVRRNIDVAHTQEHAKHTAAAMKADREALTPQYRSAIGALIEADPESNITDTDGLSDKELLAAYKDFNARQKASKAQANSDRSFNRLKENDAGAEAHRDAADESRTRAQDTREIALLDREIAAQKKAWGGDEPTSGPEHDAYWAAVGKRDALKKKLDTAGTKPWADDPAYKALSPAAKAAWDASHAR